MKVDKVQINGRLTPQLKRRVRSDRKTMREKIDVIFYTVFEDFFTRYTPDQRKALYGKCPWKPKGVAAQ